MMGQQQLASPGFLDVEQSNCRSSNKGREDRLVYFDGEIVLRLSDLRTTMGLLFCRNLWRDKEGLCRHESQTSGLLKSLMEDADLL